MLLSAQNHLVYLTHTHISITFHNSFRNTQIWTQLFLLLLLWQNWMARTFFDKITLLCGVLLLLLIVVPTEKSVTENISLSQWYDTSHIDRSHTTKNHNVWPCHPLCEENRNERNWKTWRPTAGRRKTKASPMWGSLSFAHCAQQSWFLLHI